MPIRSMKKSMKLEHMSMKFVKKKTPKDMVINNLAYATKLPK